MGAIQKKDIGGIINQVIPPFGVQYIPTKAKIADVQTIAALEEARLKSEKSVQDAREKLLPDPKVANDFFEKVVGLTGEVKRQRDLYTQEQSKLYGRLQEDPDYMFSPQGKQNVRDLYSLVSFDATNRLKNNKETFELERKKVNEKGTADDIYYDDGYVFVEPMGDGNAVRVPASEYLKARADKDNPLHRTNPLTINENNVRISNRVSDTKGDIPAMSSQFTYGESIKLLKAEYENLGTAEEETLYNQFTQFGMTKEGEPMPAIETIVNKNSSNAAQLNVVHRMLSSRLPLAARNAIAAELVRRGQDPGNTENFIDNLSKVEAGKRTSYSSVRQSSFNLVKEPTGDGGSSNRDLLDLLGMTPAAEVNSSLSGDADGGFFSPSTWFNNSRVDAPIVERNGTVPIDKTYQKSVTGGSVYQIGGDGDSPSKNGLQVNVPVLNGVVEDNPVSMYVFTGEEFDPKTNKPKTNAAAKGALVLSGDRGTTGHKSLEDLRAATRKDPSGREYIYDPDTETNRIVARRGFRKYAKVDEDGKADGTSYLKTVSLQESTMYFPGPDRSGEQANIRFVSGKNLSKQGQMTVEFLRGQVSRSVASGDRNAQQVYTAKYDQYIKLATALVNENNPQRQGAIANELDKMLSGVYYIGAALMQRQNTPGIKPSVSAKPVDVYGAYR